MLSGKRAFQKPISAETMNAILNDDPPAISQTAANIPSRCSGSCIAVWRTSVSQSALRINAARSGENQALG